MIDRTRRPCLHPRANHQHGTHLAYDKDGCRCEPCNAANLRYDKRVRYRTATGTHSYVPAGRAREHVTELLAVLTVGQIEARSGIHRTAIRVLVGTFPGRPPSKRITRTTEASLLAVEPVRVGPEQHGLVDGTGTRRRICALIALGWPARTIATRLGASSRNMWELTGPTAPVRALVTVRLRDAVTRLYDEISLVVPPRSAHTTRARNIAAARGWVPPLAWDDDTIDDPAATPTLDAPDLRGGVDDVAIDRAIAGDPARPLTRAERWLAIERLARTGLPDNEIARLLGVSDMTVRRDRQDLGISSTWKADAA